MGIAIFLQSLVLYQKSYNSRAMPPDSVVFSSVIVLFLKTKYSSPNLVAVSKIEKTSLLKHLEVSLVPGVQAIVRQTPRLSR